MSNIQNRFSIPSPRTNSVYLTSKKLIYVIMTLLLLNVAYAYQNSQAEQIDDNVIVTTIRDATFFDKISRYFSLQSVVADPISPKINEKFTLTFYELIPCTDLQRSSVKLTNSFGKQMWDIAISPTTIIDLQKKCQLTNGEPFLGVLKVTANAPSIADLYTLRYEIIFFGELDDRTLKGVTTINVVDSAKPVKCNPNKVTEKEYYKTIIGGTVYKVETVENKLIRGTCMPITDSDFVTECRDGYTDVGNQKCEKIVETPQEEEQQEEEEKEEEQQKEDEEKLVGSWKIADGICVFSLDEGGDDKDTCEKLLKKIKDENDEKDDDVKVNLCDTNADCSEGKVCEEVEKIKMCAKEEVPITTYIIIGLVAVIIISGIAYLALKNG